MFSKFTYILSVIYGFRCKVTVFLAFIIIFPRKTFGLQQNCAEMFNKSDIFVTKTP